MQSLEPGITEWMFHPSARPAAGEEGTPLGRLRPAELAILQSPGFAECMALAGVSLASYGEVVRGSEIEGTLPAPRQVEGDDARCAA